MTDDAAWPLAQHVCRTGYADLPPSAVESARRDILDTFGCMLGGAPLHDGRQRQIRGAVPSHVLAYWKFESISLQRRVSELSVSERRSRLTVHRLGWP